MLFKICTLILSISVYGWQIRYVEFLPMKCLLSTELPINMPSKTAIKGTIVLPFKISNDIEVHVGAPVQKIKHIKEICFGFRTIHTVNMGIFYNIDTQQQTKMLSTLIQKMTTPQNNKTNNNGNSDELKPVGGYLSFDNYSSKIMYIYDQTHKFLLQYNTHYIFINTGNRYIGYHGIYKIVHITIGIEKNSKNRVVLGVKYKNVEGIVHIAKLSQAIVVQWKITNTLTGIFNVNSAGKIGVSFKYNLELTAPL